MDSTIYVILVDLPLLIFGLGVIFAIAWNRNGGAVSVIGKGSPLNMRLAGIAAMFGLWLMLTVASIWLAFCVGIVAFLVLLFWVGRAAAAVGAILLGAGLVSIPFLWGWALFRSGAQR